MSFKATVLLQHGFRPQVATLSALLSISALLLKNFCPPFIRSFYLFAWISLGKHTWNERLQHAHHSLLKWSHNAMLQNTLMDVKVISNMAPVQLGPNRRQLSTLGIWGNFFLFHDKIISSRGSLYYLVWGFHSFYVLFFSKLKIHWEDCTQWVCYSGTLPVKKMLEHLCERNVLVVLDQG